MLSISQASGPGSSWWNITILAQEGQNLKVKHNPAYVI